MLLLGGPVYERISGLTKHLQSDLSLHVAIHLVIVILRIHIDTNGSTATLILCLRFVGAFEFVIHIRIRHKWNLYFNFCIVLALMYVKLATILEDILMVVKLIAAQYQDDVALLPRSLCVLGLIGVSLYTTNNSFMILNT